MQHSAQELRLVAPVEMTLQADGGGDARPALVHVAAYSGGLMNVAPARMRQLHHQCAISAIYHLPGDAHRP